MRFDELQPAVAACLAANATFAGVAIFCEFDPAAGVTAAQLAAQDAAFESALATRGLAAVVLSPFGFPSDESRGSGVAFAMTVPVAIVENPTVNRGPARPDATPPVAPLGLPALRLVDAAVRALVAQKWRFPSRAEFARPNLGTDGLAHYYLLPERILALTAPVSP